MERWEEQLVRELQKKRDRAAAAGGGAPGAVAQDLLGEAFDDLVERMRTSVDRVAQAAGLPAEALQEHSAGRFQWTAGTRRLRLRLDREAQKFFVSVESESGLEMCELWVDDGKLITDAEGPARNADPDAVVRRFVPLLFRGR